MEIKVPTTYEDITLGEYMEMQKALKGDSKDLQRLVSIACRLPLGVIKKVSQKSLKEIVAELSWMFEKPDLTKDKLIPRFWLHGIEYGFVPNVDKITVGEFADLEYFVLKGTYENLPQIMSIVFRPVVDAVGNQYSITPYDDYDIDLNLMNEMPVNVAISAMVFFYSIENKLVRSLQFYLKKVEKRVERMQSGGGMR